MLYQLKHAEVVSIFKPEKYEHNSYSDIDYYLETLCCIYKNKAARLL